ncbi:hypothetical protein V8F06_000194 [Rhypophila decipiens]
MPKQSFNQSLAPLRDRRELPKSRQYLYGYSTRRQLLQFQPVRQAENHGLSQIIRTTTVTSPSVPPPCYDMDLSLALNRQVFPFQITARTPGQRSTGSLARRLAVEVQPTKKRGVSRLSVADSHHIILVSPPSAFLLSGNASTSPPVVAILLIRQTGLHCSEQENNQTHGTALYMWRARKETARYSMPSLPVVRGIPRSPKTDVHIPPPIRAPPAREVPSPGCMVRRVVPPGVLDLCPCNQNVNLEFGQVPTGRVVDIGCPTILIAAHACIPLRKQHPAFPTAQPPPFEVNIIIPVEDEDDPSTYWDEQPHEIKAGQ